jgi:anti-sigma factor RsiW
MRCDELTALIDLYVAGDLPDELSQRVERHLLRCARCAHEVRSLEQTQALLRDAVPCAGTSPQFRERAMARLHDALAPELNRHPEPVNDRQWSLPLDDRQPF